MSRLLAVLTFALAAAGCAATAVTYVERGDRALDAGDPYQAETSFRAAVADGDTDPWVRAKVEAGLARAELGKERLDPPYKKLRGAPADLLVALREEWTRIRSLGGDRAYEAEVLEAANAVGRLVVDAARALGPGRPIEASRLVRPVTEIRDLDAGVRREAEALVKAARDLLEGRARATAAGFPLTARAYRGLAAAHGGAPVAGDPTAARFGRGIVLELPGARCCVAALLRCCVVQSRSLRWDTLPPCRQRCAACDARARGLRSEGRARARRRAASAPGSGR